MRGTCDRPLEPSALVDYWLDGTEGEALDAIEEHLLDCHACSRRLHGLVALGDGIRRLAREGALEVVVTPSFLARATQEGLRTREYRVAPGGRVDCTVTPQDDLLVSRLVGNFEGLARVDVLADEEGRPPRRIEDVPIDPAATELIVAQAMPYMRTVQRCRLRIRLLGREAAGERVVGEYTFDHYPTPH